MTTASGPLALLTLALLVHGSANAYEGEDAVPLTVGALFGKVTLERLALRLNGREVELTATLRNDETTRQTVGWYAQTPVFDQLGQGEEHADKTFATLAVSVAGGAYRRPPATRRGYFMGRDITAALAKAGIGALPDADVTEQALAKVKFPFGMRPTDWAGQVAYAWSGQLAPKSAGATTIRYRALPQFDMETLWSDSLRQRVQQHCGDPDKVMHELAKHSGGSEQVLMERYDVPIAFMKMQELALEIVQPATNWMGAHPIMTLMCGVPNAGNGASFSGTLANAHLRVSVLVVSRLAYAGERARRPDDT